MKYTKYIAGLFAGITLFSCENFDDINTNPDSVTKVSPKLLATGAIAGIMKPSNGKNFVYNQMTCKYIGWSEALEGSQYNDFGREGFGGYTSLVNYQLMVDLAEKDETMLENKKNAYKGLALFLKANQLFSNTLNVGDIPYEGILEGKDGHLTVAYNTQEDVFKFLINDLDKAHEYFVSAGNAAFDGDPIFAGKAEQWNRVSNALELRLLINLSKKANVSSLNVKAKFAEVVSRNRLLRSNADNLQLTFSSKEGQIYPFNESLHSYKQYVMISGLVIDALKENQDYRLFYYANPAEGKINAGAKEDEWDAYVGIDPSDPIDQLKSIADKTKEFCPFNNRYTSLDEGEPLIRIGYAEQNFIMAEAALRGWITGSAADYYKKGIEASMKFIADNTPDKQTFHHGRKMTADVIAQTLAQPTLQLTGEFEADLKKIITQKFIANFMQASYQAYYDYRRTGYPEFPINPITNRNTNEPTKMPMRWLYPTSEYDYNRDHVDAAVQRQFQGSDEVNKIMWILQD